MRLRASQAILRTDARRAREHHRPWWSENKREYTWSNYVWFCCTARCVVKVKPAPLSFIEVESYDTYHMEEITGTILKLLLLANIVE